MTPFLSAVRVLLIGCGAVLPALSLAQQSAGRPSMTVQRALPPTPPLTSFPVTPPGANSTIEVTVVHAVSGRSDVSILFVPQAPTGKPGAALGVQELAATPVGVRGGEPRKAIVSGGFSSSRLEIPLGLLVVDGRTVSRLNEAVARPIKDCPVAQETRRYPGILCQAASTRRWSIIKAEGYSSDMCVQAMQAGPLVVRDRRNAVCPNEPQQRQPYDRMIACITTAGDLKFIHTSAVNLFPLAGWLALPEPQGPGCETALNLAGDNSAGIAYFEPRSGQSPRFYGQGTFPLPSAFVVRWR